MALLKLSGIVTKISGKIGGSVMGTSASGPYIKQNSYGRKNNTVLQSSKRSTIGVVSAKWRALTQVQRDLWIDEVVNYPYINRVGDTVEYTGYSLFLWCNQNLYALGLPAINEPNSYSAPIVPTISFDLFENFDMYFTWSGSSANNYFMVYATQPIIGSLQPKISTFRLITSFSSSSVTGAFDIYSNYLQKFNFIDINERVFVYVKAVNKNTGAVAGITNIVNRLYTF